MLTGYIRGQELRISTPEIAADSIKYLEAEFHFAGRDWDGYVKTAYFINGASKFALVLADDRITADMGLNLTAGEWEVKLSGVKGDSRITTTTEHIYVREFGGTEGTLPDVTPTQAEQLLAKIGDMSALETEAKNSLVAAINEAAKSGGGGSGGSGGGSNEVWLPAVSDGVLTWTKSDSDIPPAPANIKGADGADGADGITPHIGDNGNWYIGLTDTGKPSRGAAGANGKDGAPGKDGAAGSPGVTPNIGANGNWYLGDTDTGKPSRGETGLQGSVGPVGPQGPQGEKGADGKTPVKGTDYWTAADKQEIIDDIHPAYYIDLAGEYPNYTCSVAMADIKAAYEAGKMLECRFAMGQYTATLPLFMPMPTANTWIFSGSGALTAMNFPAQSLTIAIVNGTVQASNTRLASKADIPTIPAALPNPNALKVKIGSTTVTYDGSSAQTVEIADGTEVSY